MLQWSFYSTHFLHLILSIVETLENISVDMHLQDSYLNQNSINCIKYITFDSCKQNNFHLMKKNMKNLIANQQNLWHNTLY